MDKMSGTLEEVVGLKEKFNECVLPLTRTPAQKGKHVLTKPELKLKSCLPVDIYNDAANFILSQDVTGHFVRNEIINDLYHGNPDNRPTADNVLYVFLDMVLSRRLQSHLGIPAPVVHKKLDFGNMIFPEAVWNMYKLYIRSLGNAFLPGDVGPRARTRSRMQNAKKTLILRGDFIARCTTFEERAAALYWERITFVEAHRVSSL